MRKPTKILSAMVASVALVLAGGTVPANAASVVGLCTIIVGEPHNSRHVTTTINSYGRLSCTIGMPNLHVRATLEKSTGTTWIGNTEDWINVPPHKLLTSTRAIACRGNTGVYRTQVAVAFTSPPGINPRYHAKTYYSIWRTISTCPPPTNGPNGVDPETVTSDDGTSTTIITLAFLSDGTIRDLQGTDIEKSSLSG